MRLALVIALVVGCSGTPAASYIEPNSRAPFKVVELATGRQHACVLLDDSSVWCWGSNEFGQGGSRETRWPLAAERVANRASAIAAHLDRTCLLIDGEVRCLGDNHEGALGVSSETRCGKLPCVTTPTAIPGISDAVAIAMGGYGICALRSDRSIWCLRRATQGPSDYQLFHEPAGDGAVALTVGFRHVCTIRSDRRVVCWGSNAMGALGVEGVAESNEPIVVPSVAGAIAIEAGADNACALAGDGTLSCWGAIAGTPIEGESAPACYASSRCTRAPIVAAGGPYAAVSMSGDHLRGYSYVDSYRGVTTSCAVTRTGETKCRGWDLTRVEWSGAPRLVDAGTQAVCGAVNDGIECAGRGGLLGGRREPVRFPQSP